MPHERPGNRTAEGKVALGQVRWKFGQAGSLAAFLVEIRRRIIAGIACPTLASSRTRLPRWRRHLFQSTGLAKREEFCGLNATSIAKGRKLVQSTGCLNCHALKLENHFSAPLIADLAKGCLADNPD